MRASTHSSRCSCRSCCRTASPVRPSSSASCAMVPGPRCFSVVRIARRLSGSCSTVKMGTLAPRPQAARRAKNFATPILPYSGKNVSVRSPSSSTVPRLCCRPRTGSSRRGCDPVFLPRRPTKEKARLSAVDATRSSFRARLRERSCTECRDHSSTPSSARASVRNSSSVAVASRSVSRTASRNLRRAADR
jgi:hypothetical protein